MNLDLVEKIANAVLYEGYLLYPYTASAVKNQQRWNFGVLHPAAFDSSEMRTECLALAADGAVLGVRLRFLQLTADGGAAERVVEIEMPLGERARRREFTFVGGEEVLGEVEITAGRVEGNLLRIAVRVANRSGFEAAPGADHREERERALQRSMLTAHTILTLSKGEFVSLIDPPEEYREAAEACRNTGSWPVLAGTEGQRDTMLCSPIILYDYPQVAPESPGDLFDSTEIDEILTLRVLTLSDEEKAEIRAGDERARSVLARAEALPPEQLAKLHGAVRGMGRIARPEVRQGSRVKLKPRRGGDILDIALAGKVGIVEAVESDFEGRTHVAVVLEDDPGRDLGLLRQPGHRFFFAADEVEAIE